MRKWIFKIIEKDQEDDILSISYDIFMMIVIAASIIPLFFRQEPPVFYYIEIITTSIFIIDYILRWVTADFRLKKKKSSFLVYPLTPFAIVDLLSILPTFNMLSESFRLFRITRIFKIARAFKFLRYSEQFSILATVVKKKQSILLSGFFMVLFYIALTALIMFNAERGAEDYFATYLDALYWSTMTVTNAGDSHIPSGELGAVISIFSSIFGIAIIALPSGVITAGYLDETRKRRKKEEEASTTS